MAEAAAAADRAWRSGWRDLAPGKRADILFRLAELIERNADASGAARFPKHGQAFGSSARRGAGRLEDVPLLRRRSLFPHGRCDPRGARRLRFHAAPAARRGGLHRAVEFPLLDRLLENGARSGGGKCSAPEAGRSFAPRRTGAGSPGCGSGCPCGGAPGACRIGIGDRRCARFRSLCAEGFVHGFDGCRAAM